MTEPSAPQQFSPDGAWWWTGTEWVPAAQAPTPPPLPAAAPASPYGQPAPTYGAPTYGAPTYGAPSYPAPPRSPNDGLAITSLVTGIVWLGGLGSLAAVITGHLSRSKAKSENRNPSGLALAGLILGYLGLAGTALIIVLAVALGGTVSKAIDTDLHARSDLRRAAIVEETYFTDHDSYTDEAGLRAAGFTPHTDVAFSVVSFTESHYCLRAEASFDTVYYYDSNGTSLGVTETPCT